MSSTTKHPTDAVDIVTIVHRITFDLPITNSQARFLLKCCTIHVEPRPKRCAACEGYGNRATLRRFLTCDVCDGTGYER